MARGQNTWYLTSLWFLRSSFHLHHEMSLGAMFLWFLWSSLHLQWRLWWWRSFKQLWRDGGEGLEAVGKVGFGGVENRGWRRGSREAAMVRWCRGPSSWAGCRWELRCRGHCGWRWRLYLAADLEFGGGKWGIISWADRYIPGVGGWCGRAIDNYQGALRILADGGVRAALTLYGW